MYCGLCINKMKPFLAFFHKKKTTTQCPLNPSALLSSSSSCAFGPSRIAMAPTRRTEDGSGPTVEWPWQSHKRPTQAWMVSFLVHSFAPAAPQAHYRSTSPSPPPSHPLLLRTNEGEIGKLIPTHGLILPHTRQDCFPMGLDGNRLLMTTWWTATPSTSYEGYVSSYQHRRVAMPAKMLGGLAIPSHITSPWTFTLNFEAHKLVLMCHIRRWTIKIVQCISIINH